MYTNIQYYFKIDEKPSRKRLSSFQVKDPLQTKKTSSGRLIRKQNALLQYEYVTEIALLFCLAQTVLTCACKILLQGFAHHSLFKTWIPKHN